MKRWSASNAREAANAALDRMLAEAKAEDERAPKPSAAELKREADWLEGYAKGKPIRNYGGNFYGISRTRCSIIKPKMIEALLKSGRAVGTVQEFIMKGGKP